MAEAEDRRRRALELHLAGATYDAIAQALGYASRSGAYKAVQEALAGLGEPSAPEDEIATAVARLDAMLTGLWAKARRGDVQAIDRVLRIEERRAVLRAMSPAQPETEQETPLDEFTRRLASRGAGGRTAKAAR